MVVQQCAHDPTVERKYVRPSEVVRLTGISKTRVFEALWEGELEAYRKGRMWLIPVEAVDRWIRGDGHAA